MAEACEKMCYPDVPSIRTLEASLRCPLQMKRSPFSVTTREGTTESRRWFIYLSADTAVDIYFLHIMICNCLTNNLYCPCRSFQDNSQRSTRLLVDVHSAFSIKLASTHASSSSLKRTIKTYNVLSWNISCCQATGGNGEISYHKTFILKDTHEETLVSNFAIGSFPKLSKINRYKKTKLQRILPQILHAFIRQYFQITRVGRNAHCVCILGPTNRPFS